MAEYELQDLLIASRWEFDVPSLIFIFVSAAFMAIALGLKADRLSVRLLQASYLVATVFLVIRTWAAIIRAQKLGGLVASSEPVFEFWNPAMQTPTLYIRIALFLVMTAATLLMLERAGKSPDR